MKTKNSKNNMSKKDKKKKAKDEEEEYIVKYANGPTKSETGQGNVYNITLQIGQPPLPPYKP